MSYVFFKFYNLKSVVMDLRIDTAKWAKNEMQNGVIVVGLCKTIPEGIVEAKQIHTY